MIRPNHHYATHTAESVRDYGPLAEFWTFLFERINKVLKAFRTSNHAGGELETSFFREFHRTVREARLVSAKSHVLYHILNRLQLARGIQEPESSHIGQAVAAMYRASADDRGTIQALSKELDMAREDGE